MIYKDPIIITGMHRSGTKLLSELLETNNVFMGKYKESNNESKFFLRINRWLLTTIGSSWDNPESFMNIDDKSKNIIKNQTKNILNSKTNCLYYGLKNLWMNSKTSKLSPMIRKV